MASIQSVQARDLRVLRVTFSAAVPQVDPAAAGDALNPENWTIAATADPGGLVPTADVAVETVTSVSGAVFDLEFDTDMSPGRPYRVTAANITGLSAPISADFDAFTPASPANRNFSIADLIPAKNWKEDDSGDLARFVACLQDQHTINLASIDRWTEILDPETAPERYIDFMLKDMGNPFQFPDLSLVDKRRLLLSLITIYKLKGTTIGIRSAISFFTGLDVDIIPLGGQNNMSLGPTGTNNLGPTGTSFIIGSPSSSVQLGLKIGIPFTSSNWAATPEQLLRIMTVVNYMKPANMVLQPALHPRLPAPKNVTISTTSGHFTVSWSTVAGTAGGYHVYWSTSPDVNYRNGTQVAASGTSVTIAATGGETVYAVVVGIDDGSGAGETGPSEGVMSDPVGITVAA